MRHLSALAVSIIALVIMTEFAHAGPRNGGGQRIQRPAMQHHQLQRERLRRPPPRSQLARVPRHEDPRNWTGICAAGSAGAACQAAIAAFGAGALREDRQGLKIVTPEGEVITEGILVRDEEGALFVQRTGGGEPIPYIVSGEDPDGDKTEPGMSCTNSAGETVRCPTF